MAVQYGGPAVRCPIRDADAERKPDGFRGLDSECRAFFFRKLRLLRQPDTALRPVQLGRDEEIDVYAGVVVEVNGIPELCERLAHRSRAAPIVLPGCPEQLPETRGEVHVVQLLSVMRMLAADDAVEQRAFIEVGACWVRRPAEDVAGQLEHVVGRAVLLRIARQLRRQETGLRV